MHSSGAARVVFIALLVPLVSVAGAQQTASLTVRVEAAETGAPIQGATVRVVGSVSRLSDPDGRVLFPGLTPGAHTIAIRAIGRESFEYQLVLRSDTAVTIALRATVARLDTVTVRPRTFRLVAEVVGRDTRLPVSSADVIIDGKTDRTDGVGILERRLSSNDSLVIVVRAMGYLPAAFPLVASRDTTMRLELEPDPVGQAMVRIQLEKIEGRSRTSPMAVKRFDRELLVRHGGGSLLDVLLNLGVNPRRVSCLIIDGRSIHLASAGRDRDGRAGGLEYLYVYAPTEIERVDVVAGGSAILVYTYEYVRRELPRVTLTPLSRFVCG